MAGKALNVLIVDDSEDDVQLLLRELRRKGYQPNHLRVDTPGAMKSALAQKKWDVVLSDYSMPGFDGVSALEMLKESGLDLPFIIVSGKIGEETAVRVMKAGAHDYILKDNLSRLFPAIEREIQDAGERRGRRQAEAELLRAKDEWERTFDAITDPIMILDTGYRIVKANRAMANKFQLTPSECVGLSCHRVVHGMGKPPKNCPFLKLLSDMKPHTAEINAPQDGGCFFMSVSPLKAASGELIGCVHYTRDITVQTRAVEALRESEEKMRLLTETAADPITMIDHEDAISYWNPAAERVFGYRAEEVMGKSLHLLLAPERYHDAFKEGFAHYRETGCGPAIGLSLEMGALRKDGTEIPVEVSFATMLLKKKRHAIGIIRDISKRKKMEEERVIIEEQLRQAQKMEAIGQLAGGIAHDFNNILTTIIGFATLMKMKLADDDPLQINIDHILASSDRAANLTRSMLAFSRRQVMNPRPTELNGIIREANAFLQRVIGEDVELHTDLAEAPLIINADNMQIGQVLMNLVTNARDAMPHGGTLVVETAATKIDGQFISTHGFGKKGAYAMITVADKGTGMDEETRERIFEPFFTTKETGKGTGLGLSVVYGIVKQHDGYIVCDTEPGRGTTFRIYLPILGKELEEGTIVPEVALPGGTETILLAEDDAQARRPSKLFLERFGYRVIEATNGEEAVTQFKAHKDEISIVLLDVIMPRLNGKETYRLIKQEKPGIKAIFLSGYTAEIFRKEEIAGQGIINILKPVMHKDVLVSIRKLLDS